MKPLFAFYRTRIAVVLCFTVVLAMLVSCQVDQSPNVDDTGTSSLVSTDMKDTETDMTETKDTETPEPDSGTTDDEDYYGNLVDQTMKSDYKLEYLRDGEWIEYDVLALKTTRTVHYRWDVFEGGFADLYTEEDSLRIRVSKSGVSDWTIRPAENVSDWKEIGRNKVEFTLKNQGVVSLEPNGHLYKNLLIRLSSPMDQEDTGSVECSRVIRLGPGIHEYGNNARITKVDGNPTFRLKGGEHLILEEGAVLRAQILIETAVNVAITGGGIIDLLEFNPENCLNDGKNPTYPFGIRFTNSKNLYIAGVTIRNSCLFTCSGAGSQNIEIRGIKTFTGAQNGDGINFHGCSNITVSDCLLRNSDDCIAVYSSVADARNISVSNCVLWSDSAHAINIGTHGSSNPNNRHYIEDVTFSDIYVPECCCFSDEYWGVIGLTMGDENICRNLTFENFKVDNITQSRLIDIKIVKLDLWNPRPGYLIEGIHIKNIHYNGDNKNGSVIFGYDEERIVRDILIEDLYINGEKMTSLEQAGIVTNNFTSDVKIK